MKKSSGIALVVLSVAALWVGKAIYRAGEVRQQGQRHMEQLIDHPEQIPPEIRAHLPPLDKKTDTVHPHFMELLVWPFRSEVTCDVYRRDQRVYTFVVTDK